MNSLIASLRGSLIVSCQAEADSPFNATQYITAFAQAAELGGAKAVRIRDVENVRAVRQFVQLPIIGLTKSRYPDGSVLITPTAEEALALQENGASIIAVDGTLRPRGKYRSGADFIQDLKRLGITIVMADIATAEDAVAAEDAGADLVATTLSGYTPETEGKADTPDFELIETLSKMVSIPIIAEGRIWTPDEALHALECGAFAVTVGSAITRPVDIVRRFVSFMEHGISTQT